MLGKAATRHGDAVTLLSVPGRQRKELPSASQILPLPAAGQEPT